MSDISRVALSPAVCRSLELLASGLLTDEVADRLGVDPKTVRRHVVDAMATLGTRSKLETVWMALKLGLIDISGVT